MYYYCGIKNSSIFIPQAKEKRISSLFSKTSYNGHSLRRCARFRCECVLRCYLFDGTKKALLSLTNNTEQIKKSKARLSQLSQILGYCKIKTTQFNDDSETAAFLCLNTEGSLFRI